MLYVCAYGEGLYNNDIMITIIIKLIVPIAMIIRIHPEDLAFIYQQEPALVCLNNM